MSDAIEVQRRDGSPCHRCGAALYLTATVPQRSPPPPDGGIVATRRLITLCPACDAEDPASRDLLAYFAIYGQVTAGTVEVFADLVRDWVARPRITEVDPEVLDREIAAWHRDPDNPE